MTKQTIEITHLKIALDGLKSVRRDMDRICAEIDEYIKFTDQHIQHLSVLDGEGND